MKRGEQFAPASHVQTRPDCRVVVIDNYDSFTFNLVQYLLELGANVSVHRNDAITCQEVLAERPSHVVLSPGPGGPRDSGVCQELCLALAEADAPAVALLGVCLGHQTLCDVLGATVTRADRVMHGKVSDVVHEGAGVFAGIASPFQAARYHSLLVRKNTLPDSLLPVASTPDDELMAVRHATRPLFGVQFHPESIASEHGHQLLRNFLSVGSAA